MMKNFILLNWTIIKVIGIFSLILISGELNVYLGLISLLMGLSYLLFSLFSSVKSSYEETLHGLKRAKFLNINLYLHENRYYLKTGVSGNFWNLISTNFSWTYESFENNLLSSILIKVDIDAEIEKYQEKVALIG